MNRDPKKRFWVQVELTPRGATTGAMFIDLSMVDKVEFNRGPKVEDQETIEFVEIIYAGTIKPIGLKGEKANWFYQQWCRFLNEQSNGYPAMDEAAPSLIEAAGSGKLST